MTIPDDDLCTWSDLPADQCAHCRTHDHTPDPGEVIRWLDARYTSTLDCGHRATAGDLIGVTTDRQNVCRRCGT